MTKFSFGNECCGRSHNCGLAEKMVIKLHEPQFWPFLRENQLEFDISKDEHGDSKQQKDET